MVDLILLTGIFISLLVGQLARIELINALANIYIHEFLMVAFIGNGLLKFGISPTRSFLKSKKVFVFCFLLIFSFLISLPEFTILQNEIALLYFIRLSLYALFGTYLFRLVKGNKMIATYIARMITIFSILLLFLTSIQFIFFPNFWGLYRYGWDPHLYRASAIYLDVFIAAALYGLFALYWYGKKNYVFSGLFAIALVLSFSRSAYIALVVSLLYFFIVRRKWRELLISLILFLSCILFVPKPFGEGGNLLRTSSIKSRIIDYKLGVSLWQKKPLFGYGYNRIRFAKEQLNLAAKDDRSHSLSSFHSSYLMLLVTLGGVGFLSFLVLLISLFMKYPGLRVYFIYILSMSVFDNVLLHVLVLLPFLFIATQANQSSFE